MFSPLSLRLLSIALPLALAACEPIPTNAAEEAAPGPLPAGLCRQAKTGLDKLSAAGGAVFTDNGEMTIEQQVWFTMAEGDRENLARILAFHASCVEGRASRAKEVTIRDEAGMVLLRQTVKTIPDVSDMLGRDEVP